MTNKYEDEYHAYQKAKDQDAWENEPDEAPTFGQQPYLDDIRDHDEQTDADDEAFLDNVTAKAAQCGHNDIERAAEVAEASLGNPEPPSELLIPDPGVITAKHWLPDSNEDFVDGGVDPRAKLHLDIEKVTIEPAVTMDPEKPEPVKVIASWWIHADCHGVMSPDIFHLDLAAGLSELAATIREDQDPFLPVRLYKEANNAYGVGVFDFAGEQYPFDLRVVVQFGTWQFPTDDGDTVNAAGFKFSIATLVVPTDSDHDIYVGRDWGRMFDEPDCMKRVPK